MTYDKQQAKVDKLIAKRAALEADPAHDVEASHALAEQITAAQVKLVGLAHDEPEHTLVKNDFKEVLEQRALREINAV